MDQPHQSPQFAEYIQTLANHFKATYQGTSTQNVLSSQQFIEQQHQREKDNFLEILLILMQSANDENLQQSVVTYLDKMSHQSEFNPNNQQISSAINTILSIIKQKEYSLKIRKGFSSLLSSLFLFSGQLKKQLIVEANNACSNNLGLIEAEALLILFYSFSKIETSEKEFTKYYSMSESLCQTILNSLNENWNEGIQALQLFTETQKQIVSNLQLLDKEQECFVQILQGKNSSSMFEKLLNLQATTPNCILVNTGNAQMDNSLCAIKADSLHTFNSIISFMFEVETKKLIQIVEKSDLTPLIQTLLPTMLTTLYTFCKASPQQIDQILEVIQLLFVQNVFKNKEWSSLIYECLYFLSKCGTQTEYYLLFMEQRNNLINIALTLLRTFSFEYNMIQNNPQEFVSLSLDTCDKQVCIQIVNYFEKESQICKTQAAQLLEALLDHIDGSVSFLANLILEIISYAIQSTVVQNKVEPSPKLKDFPFVINSTPEIIIETGFVALSVMSYVISKRQDILMEVNKFLIENYEFLIKTNTSILISARLILFLSYYYDDIFDMQSQHSYFHSYMQYIGASMSSSIKLLSIQAMDTLQNVLTTESVNEKVQPIVLNLLELLNQLVVKTDVIKLFDLIDHILQHFSVILEKKIDIVLQTVESLVERVLIQLKTQVPQDSTTAAVTTKKFVKRDMIITKSWNVLRIFSTSSYYSTNLRNQVEERLNPLFAILNNYEQVQFDEDIVLLLNEFIKKNKSVTQIERQMLPYLAKIARKNQYVLGNLFTTLNYYISYDSEIMTTSAEYISLVQNYSLFICTLQMIQIGIDVMMAKNNQINDADNSEGCVLLQLILQYFSSAINYQQIYLIYMKAAEKACLDCKTNYLQARIAGIFLSGFAANFQLTQQALVESQALPNVLQFVLQNLDKYTFPYEKKIFILGICVILKQPFSQMSPHIQDAMAVMLTSLIKILRQQQLEEQKNKQSYEMEQIETMRDELLHSNKKQQDHDKQNHDFDIDDEFNSEDDEDWEESDEDFDDDDDQYPILDVEQERGKKCLISLVSSAQHIDEYAQFKETIYGLKEKSPEMLQEFIGQLQQPEMDTLKQLMLVQRISLNIDNQVINTNGRVILKPKMRKKFTPNQ